MSLITIWEDFDDDEKFWNRVNNPWKKDEYEKNTETIVVEY